MAISVNTEKANLKEGFSLAWDTVEGWAAGFYAVLPNIIVGILFLFTFILLSYSISRLIRSYFERKERIDLGNILSDLGFWLLIIIGSGIALTIMMPSVRPGNLVASFGIGSIAMGFAFKEIIQNWLSGLLILLRMPFRRGDQISVLDAEGTVMRIEPRATIIRTYDGRDVVIPNTMVFSSIVQVHTSQETRRMDLDLTVGYDYEVRLITQVIQTALYNIDEILEDPVPQVMCWELGSTSLGIKLRWWINSERSEEVIARARAVQAIKEAFEANGIDPTDPQLIYYKNASALSDENDQYRVTPPRTANTSAKQKIKAPPLPPDFKTGASDPESEAIKRDPKSKTFLPEE